MIKQIVLVAVSCSVLTGCFASNTTTSGKVANPKTERGMCIEKGIAYFKAIGSYPKLSDGRSATLVAIERCKRTTGAFGAL